MKRNLVNTPLNMILVLMLLLSSCGGGDRDVFRIIPESTNLVITFNPEMLMEKGKIRELDFFRNMASRSAY